MSHRRTGTRPRPPLVLLGLTLVAVPVILAAFVAQALLALQPDLQLPFGQAVPVAVLVAGPLALGLFAASAYEIRRHRRDTDALRREKAAALAELAVLVESADDAIVGLDDLGRITRWNRGAERLYATVPSEAIGRPFTAFVAPDDVQPAEETFRRTLATRGRERVEAQHRRSDGSLFDASAAWSALVDGDGRLTGASVIVRDVTRQRRTAARIARSERRLSLVMGNANDAIIAADELGAIVEWNAAAATIFGLDEREALGRTLADFLERPASDASRAGTAPPAAAGIGVDMLRRLAGQTVEVRGIRANASAFPAELSVAVYEDDGRTWYTAFVRDASPRVAAERRAREAAARYQDLVEHVPGVVYRAGIGRNAPVEYVSPHIEALTGYTAAEWTGTPGLWESIVHPEDVARFLAEEGRVGTDSSGIEYRLVRKDGRVIWVRDHAGQVTDEEGEAVVWSGLLVDITDRKALEAQLVRQAFHDPLTGLANRALFADRMEHALRRSERDGAYVGLLMLDLDNFKGVNDSLGHETGDLLLKAVAARLREHVRAGSTVARLGGDEFAVLIEDLDDEEGAMAVANRIVRAFDRPFRIGTNTLITRASVGVVVDSARRRSGDWMMRSGDVAMYEAKRRGKGRWQLYDPASYLAATKRLVLESELRRAVERSQFTLLYQPIVRMTDGRIMGAEALVRWQHPNRGGLVPPGEFISVLEATGLIVELGDWALQTACAQAAEWAARFPAFTSMAVNASARQISDPTFVPSVANAVRAASIPPRLLLLEVTESVALDAQSGSPERLRTLRNNGVRVAIDDFGTGYSSLAYLRTLPVDTIKIDRTFIHGVGEDREATAVAKAIISLAATLKLQTVAEGIETKAQAAALRSLGCDLGQGFLFARPMPATELAIRLASQEMAPAAVR